MKNDSLRALQLTQLHMLKDLAAFCDEHGIVYFLASGTLLGAARHQGFIPWDDDIDVCMDVKNYRKLRKRAGRLPERYFFQDFRTDPDISAKWARIRLNGTTAMPRDMTSYNVHFGIGIDVFPLPGVAKTAFGRRLQGQADNMLGTLLYGAWAKVRGKPISWKVKLLYALLPGRMRIAAARLFERMVLLDTQHGEYATSMYYNLRKGDYVRIPARLYDPDSAAMLPFEGTLFRCPGRYDEVLTQLYGDWHALPPEDERHTDHGDIILDLENDYRKYYTGK